MVSIALLRGVATLLAVTTVAVAALPVAALSVTTLLVATVATLVVRIVRHDVGYMRGIES